MRSAPLVGLLFAACSFEAPPPQTNDAGEPISVTFERPSTGADEHSGALPIVVLLSDAAGAETSVRFAATAGTATSPDDFTLASGTLTFAPGETRKEISPTIVEDSNENEPEETFDVTLSSPSGLVLGGQTTHRVTISNLILPRVQFTQTTSTTPEGTQTSLVLMLDKGPTAEATVMLAITGGAATAADYGIAGAAIVIPANATTVSVPIGEVNDALDEDDEDIQFALTEPSANLLIGTNAASTHTIVDDDPLPIVAFTETSRTVDETIDILTLDVTLNVPSGRLVEVNYSRNGNDTASSNDATVTGSPGKLTFQPGETGPKHITVLILGDSTDEDNEDVVVDLTSPLNATLGASTHTTTIVDNDNPPTVTFQNATSSDNEGDNTTNEPVAVVLSAASSKTITVTFSHSGTLSFPQEYSLTSSPLTFNPGQTSRDIVIDWSNDGTNENNETVILTIDGATNASVGTQSVHTFTLIDND